MKQFIFLFCCLPLIAIGQNKKIMVEGISPKLYVLHTVAPKENFYSIGRIYNISPKEIAPFNDIVLEKGLSLGQIIKIPLAASNFSQDGVVAADEGLVPVYVTVKEKESLLHISSAYNNVALVLLKKWNHLSGKELSKGTELVIGYLKVKKDLSPLASEAVNVTPAESQAETEVVQTQVKEEKQTTKPVTEEIKTGIPVAKVDKKEDKNVTGEKKIIPVISSVPANLNVSSDGYFKNEFSLQTQNKSIITESGMAATFKSSSGWEDKKYYCMYNSAAPATIVKITNTVTGKIVYAKVLDIIMPDVSQNKGLALRISNSASEALGVTDESTFSCTIEYSK